MNDEAIIHPFRKNARKRFGQNFLQDTHIIQAIIDAINPKPEQFLLEIGPGQGALTFPVLKQAKQLTAIEIDRDLIASLHSIRHTLSEQFNLIEADALTFDYASLKTNREEKIRVYGNLPYNITSPLLFRLLSFIHIIQDGHFMVQKEVAERIAAEPGSKDYGRLSVMIQYYCQAEILFDVGPEAFYPKPKVNSSIIRLIPYDQSPYDYVPQAALESVVKQSFAHRRKTLRNNLKGLLSEQHWQKLNINPQLRPEELSISQFVSITQIVLDS